jgi:hypothetical protein
MWRNASRFSSTDKKSPHFELLRGLVGCKGLLGGHL